MFDLVFYLFAALTLLSALMVPCSRNPVNSAMYMIVSFVGTAALFGMLSAFFLSIVQVLVYAGAVMVLFLFIIMLLNVDKIRTLPLDRTAAMLSGLALLGMLTTLAYLFVAGKGGPFPGLPLASSGASVRQIGFELFGKFQLPIQICGFLLLISMVGVIYISKKQPDTLATTTSAKVSSKEEQVEA